MFLHLALRHTLLVLLSSATLAHASTWTPAGPFRAANPVLAFAPGAPDVLVVSAAGAVARSTDGGDTFLPVAGQSGYASFAASAPAFHVLYGFGANGGSNGVNKSTDGGLTWQVVSATPGIYGRLVAVAPTNPAVIYNAQERSGGLLHSTDGGASFSAWSTNLQALPALSLAVSPADANVVYAGTIGPLFKSTDGGVHLTEIGPSGIYRSRAIAIDPFNATTLYVVFDNGVYKSTDSGATFARFDLAIPAWGGAPDNAASDASIAIDPADTRSLYVAVQAHLWHSADGGATWSGPLALPGGASDVRLHPATGSLFAVGDQLYRSTDRGAAWNVVSLGLSDERLAGLVANPLAPERIYAVGTAGDWLSTDGGRHFAQIAGLPTEPRTKPRLFAIDPARPLTVYAAFPGGQLGTAKLFRSLDGGVAWSSFYAAPTVQSRPAESLDAFAASPAAGTLYMISAAYGGGVSRSNYLHRSTDDGLSWTVTQVRSSGGTPVQDARVLRVDPRAPATLYLGAAGFHRSTDGGSTWTVGGAPFDDVRPDTGYPVGALALLPTTPVTLLASTGSGVFRSVDGGRTWGPSSTGLSAAAIVDLAPDPMDPNLVYAATDSAGIYRSVDGGHTWSAFDAGLDTMETFGVLATGGGVLASTRSGARLCADGQCAGGRAAQQVKLIEFYNTTLNHYFMTANAAEAAGIDTGSAGPGWVRTGATFNVWPTAADAPYPAAQVYRFYGTLNVGPNSHFYTISSAEFAQVQNDRGWYYEYGNWFWAYAPAAPGECPAASTPVYRAYNDRFAYNDSNHRYTASLAVLQSMAAQGWIPEGVVLCVPL